MKITGEQGAPQVREFQASKSRLKIRDPKSQKAFHTKCQEQEHARRDQKTPLGFEAQTRVDFVEITHVRNSGRILQNRDIREQHSNTENLEQSAKYHQKRE